MKLKTKTGVRGRVTALVSADSAYREKLLRMGLTRNAEFRVVRKTLFGGPIELEVKAHDWYCVAMRPTGWT